MLINFKEYTKEMAKQFADAIQKNFSLKAEKQPKGNGEFEVIATTSSVDRDGETISADGWVLENYMKNPVILWAHEYFSLPIGVATEVRKEDGKIIVKGVFASHEFAQEVRKLYDDGFLKAVSVGFIPIERNGPAIAKAELLELSFVPVPSNADALSLTKMKEIQTIYKTVVAEHETPMADEGMEWDASGAEKRMMDSCMSKNDAGEDVVDWEKYSKCFAWYDEANKETVGAYKLPHHDIVDGEMKVLWKGVYSAMAALLGARGGVEIQEEDKQGVYDHIKKHYEQFGKDVPELKEYTQIDLDKLFPEFAENVDDDSQKDIYFSLISLKHSVLKQIDGALSRFNVPSAQVKEGRVISTKNRGLIETTVKSLGDAQSLLTELLEASEPKDSDLQKAADQNLKALQSCDKVIEAAILQAKQASKLFRK